MIKLIIPKRDLWDEKKQEFVTIPEETVRLEHSLLAIARWETKYHKPFLTKDEKGNDELFYYIRCMNLSDDLLDESTALLIAKNQENLFEIKEYLDDPATATTVKKKPSNGSGGSFVTSELIYYYMTSLMIPFECEKWNLNRLLKLIEVCDAKNTPAKKPNRKDTMNRHRSLNAARRAKRH